MRRKLKINIKLADLYITLRKTNIANEISKYTVLLELTD